MMLNIFFMAAMIACAAAWRQEWLVSQKRRSMVRYLSVQLDEMQELLVNQARAMARPQTATTGKPRRRVELASDTRRRARSGGRW